MLSTLLTVQWNEPASQKGKKKQNKTMELVSGPGWSQTRGMGMIQSNFPSIICIFWSHTQPHHQALVYQDWEMQDHQKLQMHHPTVRSSCAGPC